MEAGVVVDAEVRAQLVAAVGSVAGLVDELAGVVASPSAAGAPYRLPDADADPLQELSEACLDGLGVLARVEAATAAAKVQLVAAYAEAAAVLEGPPASAYEASAREVSRVAEVACVLTIGERAASALLGEAHALIGWISPTGRCYPAEHPDREPPLWPPGCLPATDSTLEQAILARLAA
ncbi:hypothetical protein [Pseudarthrobacter sp. C1]|uniref:hypothetical protein n=1 Tax=Pseudarthrobacter sp. C1 TaxID=3108940 RepID=UPI002B059BF4|nr:hypothetical protein [Pseudarthrobacter sp. C1]MEA3552646.1 hypothetical protein [Pseudarthrobacter sp. C1]